MAALVLHQSPTWGKICLTGDMIKVYTHTSCLLSHLHSGVLQWSDMVIRIAADNFFTTRCVTGLPCGVRVHSVHTVG